jgi:peptide/nickel transport system permease protein
MSELGPLAVAPPATEPDHVPRRWNASLVVGLALVGFVVLLALVSYVWTPYSPTRTTRDNLATMSWSHPLGADRSGIDVLSQIMVGARTTLYVGIVAVAIAAVIGVPLGALAAQRGGWLGEVVMRVNDVVFAFPALLLAIMLAAAYGASTTTAMVAIGIASIPVFARLTRASALQVLASEYVMAARASGRRPIAVFFRHVLPNVAPVLIVQGTVLFALAVLAEAALSYLGLGTPIPTPSWGRMLRDSQTFFDQRPTLALFPGLAIALAVLGFNLLGDGLRDVLDPKLRRARSGRGGRGHRADPETTP